MSSVSSTSSTAARTAALFDEYSTANATRTSKIFGVLMAAQWLIAIFVAIVLSPYAWAGKVHTVHTHVLAAVFLGGAITSLPLLLVIKWPAAASTRFVIAAAQMLWSALLIHLSGGRIETHFHIFVSLAFVAFYRDWRILVPATIIVALDHFLRGVFWPESVYGIANPEWWRFFEHGGWVVFEDIVLVLVCLRGGEEVHLVAERQAVAEEKTTELSKALEELRASHETVARVEKLAAVGQLAASVGHELRNPLAAVRNAQAYITRRLEESEGPVKTDPRVKQFIGVIDRELNVCSKIISDLLDFSRERAPNLAPVPLRPLVDEAIGLVPPKSGVRIVNEVPEDLPIPTLDKEQFRQVLINLVQNAVEAMNPDQAGEVTVRAEGGNAEPWRIRVVDNGSGIPADVVAKIFEPLFSTKNKGTGLGLAVVSSMVRKHGGTISVESGIGKGTEFLIELPPVPQPSDLAEAV
jgi:two-component system sensor histidine kinase HydH